MTDLAGFVGIVVTTGFFIVDFLLLLPSNLLTNVDIYGNDNIKPKPGTDLTTDITTGKNPPNNL